MKKRFPSFLAGALTALMLTALATTALAASGKIGYNGASVTVGGTALAAGDITASGGGKAPGSIQFTDAAGNVTHYLPLETIDLLPGVDASYDAAARTVKVERGKLWEKQDTEKGVQYASEDTGLDYTGAPGYTLTNLPEGWGLESVREMTGRSGQDYRNGEGGRISFACSYPNGGGYGWSPGSGEISCAAVTVKGCEAELYSYSNEYVDSTLLVWENLDGVLFWFTGSDVEPETLAAFASAVAPTAETAPDCEAGWLPSGYSWFETNTSAGSVETTWTGRGGNITLTCSVSPLLLPEGAGETVAFGDVDARFWEAEKPHEADEDEPQTVGGVTITTTTISGVRAADAATLAWTDAAAGVNFRLHGTVDRETLVRVARNLELR